MSEATDAPKAMTTIRRADGENIYDEFGWVADDEENLSSDYEGFEEPVEYVRETWVLTSSESFWGYPEVFACDFEDDEPCDEDAVEWVRTSDGAWLQACARHRDADGSEAVSP